MKTSVGSVEISLAVGCTVRTVQRRSVEEHWPCIEIPGNGGLRKEYPVAQLPPDIQKALAKREAAEAKKNLPALRGETLPVVVQSVEELKGWQRDVMTARTLVLRHLAKLEDELGGPAKAANELIRQAKEGILPAVIQEALKTANARSGRNRTIDRTTLWRWKKKAEAGALAPADTERTDAPEWAQPAGINRAGRAHQRRIEPCCACCRRKYLRLLLIR